MILRLIALLFAIQPVFADPSEISLGEILDDGQNTAADIAYTSFVPEFEENQNPDRSVKIELYFAEDDQSEASLRRLSWIRSQLKHDLKENPQIATQYEAYGKTGDAAEGNSQVNAFWSELGVTESSVSYEKIPSDANFDFNPYEGTQASRSLRNAHASRVPASGLGRSFWTFMRFTSSFGASFIGLTYGFHVAPETALFTSILPALGSASITYFSPQFGRYLVSKSWSRAVLEGSNPFTQKLQTLMKIDPASMALKTPEQQAKIVSKLHGSEEALRWYLTEFAFPYGLIKVPQRLAQITHEGMLSALGTGVRSSMLGFLAQGSGDLAVAHRKVQKFKELREALISGQITSPEKERIVKELNEILDPAIHRNVDGTVHPLIQKVENWARSRATLMSFVSVAGVVLNSVGVSASNVLLVTLGVVGATYYAKVNGWFKPEGRISQALQNTRAKLSAFASKFISLPERICKDDLSGDEGVN